MRHESLTDVLARIAEERKRLGLTQAECAESIGVGQPLWSAWEGAKKAVTYEVAIRMATAVGLDLALELRRKKSRKSG
jgi:transcriptional regulator with XRE-family HTH domain